MTDSPHPASKSDRLALLYHLAQTFNSSLDLDQVLNLVIDEVIIALRAERGFVMLREADGHLSFRVARGIDQQTIDDPNFQVSRSVIENVASQGQPILTFDAQTDPRFSMRQSVTILGLRSVLCVPLTIKAAVLGVIYVDNRLQAGNFTASDLELLSAIASNAAIAIENARLYQLAVEKGRLERELQMARQVQVSLLPAEVPQIDGWEFTARWLPARQVSGDFYDFLPEQDGRVGLVIADVSDKGMPAALFMGLTRTLLRASLDQGISPAAGIQRANRLIHNDAANGMFVTLFYLSIDVTSGDLTYVNAGHNPPLLVRFQETPATAQPHRLTRTGMALGVLPDAHYEQQVIHLEPGDFVVLYTDGVTDANNPAGQPFGMGRLEARVSSLRSASTSRIADSLERAVAGFSGDSTPVDDITLLVIKRL